MLGFICSAPSYTYKGLEIEIPGIGGPCPLKKNGDPYERWPKWVRAIMEEFEELSEEEVNKYRTGGGCERIG